MKVGGGEEGEFLCKVSIFWELQVVVSSNLTIYQKDQSPSKQLLSPSPGHDFSAPLYRWVKLEVHFLPGSAASIRLQSSKSRAFPLITRQASGDEEGLLLQDIFWKKSLLAFIYTTLWKGMEMKGTEKTNTDIQGPRVVRKYIVHGWIRGQWVRCVAIIY